MVSQTNEMIILKFARVHINAGHLTNRPGNYIKLYKITAT